MTKNNYTHLSILADRSGSMNAIKADAEGGINSLIQEQAKQPGDITVTLYQFDNLYEKVFGPISAADAPLYRLVPRSNTALIDSLARAIKDTGSFLSELPEKDRPSNVVFAVVTDGHENASREFTKPQVAEMIGHQQDTYNWEFVFIGANLDAFGEAQSYNIRSAVQYQGTGQSVKSAYAVAGAALTNTRSTGATMDSFLSVNNNVDAEGNVSQVPTTPKPEKKKKKN